MFTWRDLLVVVKHAPPDSALQRSIGGADAAWTLTNQLIATAVDSLRWLVWAKTEDAQKRRNIPKPIPRPGVSGGRGRMKDAEKLPVSEVARRLALPRSK